MNQLSARTRIIAAVCLLTVVVVCVPLLLQLGSPHALATFSNIAEPLVVGAVAIGVIALALRFPKGEPARWHWALIGLGALCFALGDLVWAYYELVLDVPAPYPGAPDILYLEVYVLMAAGLLGAAYSFRWLTNVRAAAITSYSLAAAGFVVLYFTLLNHILADPTETPVTKALAIAYPVSDLLLLAAPALTLVIALRVFSSRMVTWPWLLAATGALVLAAADAAYVYLDWQGLYASGNPIDVGWIIGHVLLIVAVSVDLDTRQLPSAS